MKILLQFTVFSLAICLYNPKTVSGQTYTFPDCRCDPIQADLDNTSNKCKSIQDEITTLKIQIIPESYKVAIVINGKIVGYRTVICDVCKKHNMEVRKKIAERQIALASCKTEKTALTNKLSQCRSEPSCLSQKIKIGSLYISTMNISINVQKISQISDCEGMLKFTATLKNNTKYDILFGQNGADFNVYSGDHFSGYKLEATKKIYSLSRSNPETLTFTINYKRNLINNHDFPYAFTPSICTSDCTGIGYGISDWYLDYVIFPNCK